MLWSITRREEVDGNRDVFGAFSCFTVEGTHHWCEGHGAREANDVTLSAVEFGDDQVGFLVSVKDVLTIF